MQTKANRRALRGVSYLPIEDIRPGVMQPRRQPSRDGLEELRDSIAENGILQPLTVRCKGAYFELIAGERRLRAARMAGLCEVPCIVVDADMERSGEIALIENIQRRDLDFVEEAEGISRLIRLFGLSQEQAARRLGKSQSAVANKLRLLRLPEDVLQRLRSEGLTERHARALLRLGDAEQQRAALDFIIDQRMTVASAEEYVEKLAGSPTESARRSVFVMKDLRLFLNTLERALAMLRTAGFRTESHSEEHEDGLRLTVEISKPK